MAHGAAHRRRGYVCAVLLLGCSTLAGALGAAVEPPADGGPARIHLKAVEFDPARGAPVVPWLAERFREGPPPRRLADVPGARTRVLVQFAGRLTRARRTQIETAGARVEGVVPHDALLVGLPPRAGVSAIAALSDVRAVVPYRPEYRVGPGLAGMLGRPPAAPSVADPHPIRALLFRGADADALADAVRVRFSALDVRVTRVRGAASPGLTLDVAGGVLVPVIGFLARDPEVEYVERVVPLRSYNDNAVWIGQSYDRATGPAEALDPDPKPYPLSATIWSRGLLGQGQIVAVADTDLEYATCFWDDPAHPIVPQQIAPPAPLAVDPAHRKVLAVNGILPQSLSTTGSFRHGTHVAGSVAGDDVAHLAGPGDPGHDTGDGMAPLAKILFEDISIGDNGRCLQALLVPSIYDLLQQEYDAGARISTNSWGSGSGTYTGETRDLDRSVWEREDLLVLFSAGNDGAGGFDDYAACKNCVAVGATENYEPAVPRDPENVAGFSSLGPVADGRLKPDVMAPGDQVLSNRFATQYIGDENDPRCNALDPDVCFPVFGGCYITDSANTCSAGLLSGTSMSTPIAAGLAALARQYFTDGFYPSGSATPADARTPSAALLKAVLIDGARNLTGTHSGAPLAEAPTNVQGWGGVVLEDALFFAGDARRVLAEDVANASGITTGQTATRPFAVTSSSLPLRVTLVWTDPPGVPAAAAALVNDLDLEVEGPGGTIYRGNRWTADDPGIPGDRESLPNPPDADALNNVEGVRRLAPVPGAYVARVIASDVPGPTAQGYALVIGGGVDEPPAGAVPNGASVAGPPLRVTREPGGDLTLTWGPSCRPGDDDYEVYEGVLGDFTSHAPRFCSTGGATSKTFPPADADRYYLVVPRNANREGSHGADGTGAERPPGASVCLPRAVGACG